MLRLLRCSVLLCLLSLRSYTTENKICLNYKQYFFGLFHWSAATWLRCCILLIMLNCFFGLKAKLTENTQAGTNNCHGNLSVIQSLTRNKGLYKIYTTKSLLFAINVCLTPWRKKIGLPYTFSGSETSTNSTPGSKRAGFILIHLLII